MQRLVSGVHQFQNDIFGERREFFERLARGQNPLALFITCSDSRINPNLLTQTEPGELFILRNAGAIVPPPNEAQPSGEAATIEFAVAALGVRDIVICGHSHCGAMAGLLDPAATERLPAMRAWLRHADTTRRIIDERYSGLSGPQRLTATIEENVLVQLGNLRAHRVVSAALTAGAVRLHGWVYKLETGQVFCYDPREGQFSPLGAQKPADAPALQGEFIRSI